MRKIILNVKEGVVQPELPLPQGIALEIRDYDCRMFGADEVELDVAGVPHITMVYVGPGLSRTTLKPPPDF